MFDLMEKFSGYGFNKSHAAPYALIAYQTAYLKANYPAEFFAAAMNFELGDTDKLNIFRQELARQSFCRCCRPISIAPIPLSRWKRGERQSPPSAMPSPRSRASAMLRCASVVGGARGGRPFKDLFDFVERIDPRVINRKQMENLATAGAFDGLNKNRAQVLASIDMLLKHSHHSA